LPVPTNATTKPGMLPASLAAKRMPLDATAGASELAGEAGGHSELCAAAAGADQRTDLQQPQRS
jgi:hypothetical protein